MSKPHDIEDRAELARQLHDDLAQIERNIGALREAIGRGEEGARRELRLLAVTRQLYIEAMEFLGVVARD